MSQRKIVLGLITIFVVGIIVNMSIYFALRKPYVWTVEHFFDTPLPPTASVLEFIDQAGMFGGDYYFCLDISRDDYEAYTTSIGLHHEPDLFDMWPSALSPGSPPSWWDVVQTNDKDTLYLADPARSAIVITRYEGNVLYCRFHVY